MAEPAIEMWMKGDYRKVAADHQIMCEQLCEDLCISPAHRVLDVACGTGNTTIAAARRRATVVGLDFAPPLLEMARKRAEAEGVSGIEFVEGDARRMPFPDASFDMVVSTLGATFMPDQAAMARELMRLTKPGGKIALTAFLKQSLASEIYDISAALVPPPASSGPPAYTWTDSVRAAELLGSGCISVEVKPGSFDACFASAEAFFEHNMAYYGPMMSRFAVFSEEQQKLYKERVIEAMASHNRDTSGALVARFAYATIIATRR